MFIVFYFLFYFFFFALHNFAKQPFARMCFLLTHLWKRTFHTWQSAFDTSPPFFFFFNEAQLKTSECVEQEVKKQIVLEPP